MSIYMFVVTTSMLRTPPPLLWALIEHYRALPNCWGTGSLDRKKHIHLSTLGHRHTLTRVFMPTQKLQYQCPVVLYIGLLSHNHSAWCHCCAHTHVTHRVQYDQSHYYNGYCFILSYTKIRVVCPSVCNGRSAETDMTPSHKLLYLCLWSSRSRDSVITTNGSHGTSYRHEG